MMFSPSDWLAYAGLTLSPVSTLIITLACMLVLLAILHAILHHGILRMLRSRMRTDRFVFLNLIGQSPLFRHVAMLAQGVALGLLTRLWIAPGATQDILLAVSRICMLLFTLLAIFAFLDIVLSWCFHKQIAIQLPLKGIV